jgi:hypothetical protein
MFTPALWWGEDVADGSIADFLTTDYTDDTDKKEG